MSRTCLRARALVAVLGTAASLTFLDAGPATASPALPLAPSVPSLTSATSVPSLTSGGATEVVVVHTSSGSGGLRTQLARVDPGAAVRHDLGPETIATGPHAAAGGPHAVSVRIPVAGAAAQLVRLAALPGVTSVEPPVARTLSDAPRNAASPTAAPQTAAPQTFVPNDPDFPRQQGYLDAVDAPAAWAREHGSAAVTIAVVDSGVDVTNPDLQGKIVGSYDATDPHSGAVTDVVGHGTFVAGVAAADTGNGIGIAGAGFDTRLLAVKVADDDGGIAIDDEVRGIRWAADHGADIINLSLGGPQYSQSEADAVAYAQARGCLVVAAAGNDGGTTVQYPAGYPGVLAVGATDTGRNTRASFSDHGSWVTVAAPGVHVFSTVPVRGSRFFSPGNYAYADGTSFSTPIVSGEAALIKAENPALTATALRAAIVSSAHGYQGLGLGAGSVDFAAALDHAAPGSTPSDAVPTGNQDDVQVIAHSTAPAVAFRLDGLPYGRPVPVVGGRAVGTIATYGFADGRHVLSAVDCSAFGECSTDARTSAFTLTSTPATLDSPATGATLTGRAHLSASRPGGGGLRLLVDGRPTGFRSAAPYTFTVSTSGLRDGRHTLAVQLCSTDGTHCDGPVSAPATVTSDALHPTLGAVSPARFSPNGDHIDDATTVRFTLPSTEQAEFWVIDHDGTTVAHRQLGTLAAGAHTWTWRGNGYTRARLADGTYTLALATAGTAPGGSTVLHGWVQTDAVLDTVAPSIHGATGGGSTFYPYPDGYRDTFTSATSLGDAGTLALTVTDARGRTVRRIAVHHGAGAASITWSGTDAHGHRVAPGRYRFRLTVTDAAGNSRSTAAQTVTVSGKRLVHTSAAVVMSAARTTDATGSSPCAHVRTKGTAYRGGIVFANSCPVADYDIALAQYELTVPHAIRYTSIAIGAYGRSLSRRSQLTVSVDRTDGVLEVPGYVTVDAGPARWNTIATVPAASHIDSHGHVGITVVLTAAFPGANTFDARWVWLRVGLVVLR